MWLGQAIHHCKLGFKSPSSIVWRSMPWRCTAGLWPFRSAKTRVRFAASPPNTIRSVSTPTHPSQPPPLYGSAPWPHPTERAQTCGPAAHSASTLHTQRETSGRTEEGKACQDKIMCVTFAGSCCICQRLQSIRTWASVRALPPRTPLQISHIDDRSHRFWLQVTGYNGGHQSV
jgi:hypothetical protein